MILPIVAYGDPVLKKVAIEIDKNYTDLNKLVENMFDTMYDASGVGLAAPQIGKSIRLFIVDAAPFADDEKDLEAQKVKNFKEVFFNATILKREGEKCPFTEGCLSIPKIREEVLREPKILIEYYDLNWKKQTKEFDGLAARIIQHEYDHIEGKLFIDHLSQLRKKLLKGKLNDISIGKVDVDYRMKFPSLKSRK
jgi:peptide deformylase